MRKATSSAHLRASRERAPRREQYVARPRGPSLRINDLPYSSACGHLHILDSRGGRGHAAHGRQGPRGDFGRARAARARRDAMRLEVFARARVDGGEGDARVRSGLVGLVHHGRFECAGMRCASRLRGRECQRRRGRITCARFDGRRLWLLHDRGRRECASAGLRCESPRGVRGHVSKAVAVPQDRGCAYPGMRCAEYAAVGDSKVNWMSGTAALSRVHTHVMLLEISARGDSGEGGFGARSDGQG
ncbi:hypothetical protein DFH09DRAFT_440903 [Mycena vulgaris]|nr:hypothetical protein DFH09DRAFT_440903 [Mycena vulgaris]